jgi:uncharacterized protein YybS (DUF2232 family)
VGGSIIKSRYIRDLIIGTGLCMAILAIAFSFPVLGVFALILLPLPVLFYRLKLGRNSAGIIMAVCFSVLMVVTRSMGFDMLYFGILLATGFLIGECIERQFGIEKTIIHTGAGILVVGLAGVMAIAASRNLSLGELFSNYTAQYFAVSGQLYSNMGIDKQQLDVLHTAVMYVLPGMIAVSLISTIWLNILIILKMLKKRGFNLKNLDNLNHYQAPEYMVWFVIALGVSLFLPVNALRYFSINGLIVLMLVYFFQGIAIVSFFFQKKESPTPIRVFCYSLIAVQLYVLLIVIGLGFFDTWINFRKLDTQK